ncbi:MAG TPA: hypothetical protein VJN92_01850 [Candidatus Acidoferrum sp.]|nr:hypothetical protein [Candidatus Acidoferrum sp.]
MLKRNCVVKYVDTSGIEHTVRVEAESLFEAAIRGLQRLDSSFGAGMWDGMSITVEVYAEPTTYGVMVQKLKRWIKSEENHATEGANPGRLPTPSRGGTKGLKNDLGNTRPGLRPPI